MKYTAWQCDECLEGNDDAPCLLFTDHEPASCPFHIKVKNAKWERVAPMGALA